MNYYNCNNFDLISTLTTLYIGVVITYRHCVFYHLQLKKLCANVVNAFEYVLVLPKVGYK